MKLINLIRNPVITGNVYRYSGTYCQKPESLKEHVHDVMLLAYILMIQMEKVNPEYKYDRSKVLISALFHDVDENITGDMPRTTKYSSPELKDLLDECSNSAIVKLEQFIGKDSIFPFWSEAKEGKDGMILRVADLVSVYLKVWDELHLLNNRHFLGVASNFMEYLKQLISKIQQAPYYNDAEREYLVTNLTDIVDDVHEYYHKNVTDSDKTRIKASDMFNSKVDAQR